MFERCLLSYEGYYYGEGLPECEKVKVLTFLFRRDEHVLAHHLIPFRLKLELQCLFAAVQLFWRELSKGRAWEEKIKVVPEPTNVPQLIDLFIHMDKIMNGVRVTENDFWMDNEWRISMEELVEATHTGIAIELKEYASWVPIRQKDTTSVLKAIKIAINYLRAVQGGDCRGAAQLDPKITKLAERMKPRVGGGNDSEPPDIQTFFDGYDYDVRMPKSAKRAKRGD